MIASVRVVPFCVNFCAHRGEKIYHMINFIDVTLRSPVRRICGRPPVQIPLCLSFVFCIIKFTPVFFLLVMLWLSLFLRAASPACVFPLLIFLSFRYSVLPLTTCVFRTPVLDRYACSVCLVTMFAISFCINSGFLKTVFPF